MTLGGLALAVGILVDDATVTIENIERHLHLGSDLHKAILDGAGEIAVPALVSTLCICIVFVPMFFLSGVARFLFAPLAEAVVFAMLASYVLSRTLVPTLVMLLMDHTSDRHAERRQACCSAYIGPLMRASRRLRAGYTAFLRRCWSGAARLPARSWRFACSPAAWCSSRAGFLPERGRRPNSPAHAHAHRHAHRRDGACRRIISRPPSARIIPPRDLGTVLDNLGAPISSINISYSNSGTFGTLDGEIQLSLNEGHRPTKRYIEAMRRDCPQRFPGVEFFFQPADMVTQILNFGLPAADRRVVYRRRPAHQLRVGRATHEADQGNPGHGGHAHPSTAGSADAVIANGSHSVANARFERQRCRPEFLISTARNVQTSPGFWLDPANGVVYNVTAQAPQYAIDSVDALLQYAGALTAGRRRSRDRNCSRIW